MRALVWCLVALASSAFAESAAGVDARLASAVAKNNGYESIDTFTTATLTPTKTGWTAVWSHEQGEGHQDCTAAFRTNGTLVTMTCTFEVISHSMGPMNARWKRSMTWKFDASGKQTSVGGREKSVLISTNKVGVDRVLTAPDEDFDKPLLLLDEALRAKP